MSKSKSKPRQFEVMIITGRRITGSFPVAASSYSEADKLSEPERKKRGVVRYRIADASSKNRPKHGGNHERTWDHRGHYGERIM